ncbi:prepilin peptidase, partial [Patescibacteria group bacterium]|nr:prepilin peptidase [Patescibacteria group bacterium]
SGSFVNAFVWRMHENKNWVSGRSECVWCHHHLGLWDLIPVLSWLWLKARCRYCQKRISLQYPLVEIMVALVFVLSYMFWPRPISEIQIVILALWLICATGLIALAIYDLRWMLLPSKIIYAVFGVALVMTLLSIIQSSDRPRAIVYFLIATLIGGGFFYVIYILSKGRWIGGGDVRLGYLLGLLAATPSKSFLVLFIAALMGCIVGAYMAVFHKMKRSTPLPFGPFLIAAMLIVELAGGGIIGLYSRLLIPA